MKKLYTDLLVIIVMIFMFFMSMNAYAVEEGKIDLQEVYKNSVETVNKAHELEVDDYNAAYATTVSGDAKVATWVVRFYPEATSGNALIQESENLPISAKRGIYGMTEDSLNSMYQSQPLVNVYAHLAEEWVPGYENTSVYAADSGYEVLRDTGIDKIWSVSRNITYVLFIIIMIVVGFMIMFRSKLGGQTLVTLGNTLPNIILALIGVTFSFAIAGILIDIGGLIMGLLADIVREVGEFDHIITLESFTSIFDVLAPQALIETIENLLGIEIEAGGSFFEIFKPALGLSFWFSFLPGIGGASFATLVMLLIIVIIGTIGVFMVFMTLLKAYLGILLHVITGPFQIVMSAIPGKNVAFINWIKNIFRNVLVYPITFAFLNLPSLLYSLSGGELNLPGPDQLTLGQQKFVESLLDGTLINSITIFLLQILVLFLASKADKYAEVIIPPTSSKEALQAAQQSQVAISKIPLVGKLLVKQ